MEKNITPINQLSWKDRLKSYKKHPGSFILLLLVGASAVITVTVLVYLVGYILIHGVPYLRPSLFSPTYNSDNVSMMPAIINTITMVLLALLFSVPFGIGAAIYLVEYAKKGNKLVELVRITAETLTGIPSIIYGLFGMLFFVTALHWGYSMLAGAATLAIMVLPVIMRTTEEALLCVPDMYREGSFGLGAGKLRTIFKIGDSGYFVWYHPCDRTYRRRDSGTDLYGRNRCGGSRCHGFRTNPCDSYVFAVERGTSHK